VFIENGDLLQQFDGERNNLTQLATRINSWQLLLFKTQIPGCFVVSLAVAVIAMTHYLFIIAVAYRGTQRVVDAALGPTAGAQLRWRGCGDSARGPPRVHAWERQWQEAAAGS